MRASQGALLLRGCLLVQAGPGAACSVAAAGVAAVWSAQRGHSACGRWRVVICVLASVWPVEGCCPAIPPGSASKRRQVGPAAAGVGVQREGYAALIGVYSVLTAAEGQSSYLKGLCSTGSGPRQVGDLTSKNVEEQQRSSLRPLPPHQAPHLEEWRAACTARR